MLKLKLDRKKIDFEYEFADGTKETFSYLDPTTAQLECIVGAEGVKQGMQAIKTVMHGCLKSGGEGAVDKLVEEQTSSGNIYDFKSMLDVELGKLKKSAKKG
ncbi:hypothetical protein ACM66T_10235 [Sulfurimonas sp. ST-25]|uniref:hypothetical protein n=1 Tax=Sulfurimonas sp. ST-25 TaxID=3400151 RepID=UPI003A86D2D2